MNMLRNFTIRFVMLTILGIFLFNVGGRWAVQHLVFVTRFRGQ